jgi:ribosomal protein S27E
MKTRPFLTIVISIICIIAAAYISAAFAAPPPPAVEKFSTDDLNTQKDTINPHLEPPNQKSSNVDIVIAQFNENIDFLENPPFSEHNIICYYKGKTKPRCKNCSKMVALPNVGKCDHTYLYHIINNYDNLADITCFFPASCLMNAVKQNKTFKTLQYIKETNNSVFIGVNVGDVYKSLYGFKLDTYKTGHPENQAANPDAKLKPCEIRPFGKWYNSLFGNMKATLVDYTSIFAVRREHILQHPKSYYEKLISYVDNDISPECGHYVERAWVAIFSPLPPSCLYNNNA